MRSSMMTLVIVLGVLVPAIAWAGEAATGSGIRVQTTGVTGLWMLANLSYAGMRAQAHPSRLWRVLSFLVGFPGTLLSFFTIEEGGCRAYGVTLPPGRSPTPRVPLEPSEIKRAGIFPE